MNNKERRLAKMKELAIKEAKNLKKFATKEEIDRLDAGSFNPQSFRSCLYGQMTGNCQNERAKDLIVQCCERVYSDKKKKRLAPKNFGLNGKPDPKVSAYNRVSVYTSPIEMLIFPNNGGREYGIKIIDFLKGNKKRLVL